MITPIDEKISEREHILPYGMYAMVIIRDGRNFGVFKAHKPSDTLTVEDARRLNWRDAVSFSVSNL